MLNRLWGPLIAGILLAGCAQKAPSLLPTSRQQGDWFHNMLVQGAGKVAVFSVNTDSSKHKEEEMTVVKLMREQGFDAVEGHEQIPSAGTYSADDLARLLLKSGFKNIAEVLKTNTSSPDGSSEQWNFKMHAIADPSKVKYSTLKENVAFALGTLLQMLIHAGLSQL